MSRKMAAVITICGVIVTGLAFVVRLVVVDSPFAFYISLALGLLSIGFGLPGLTEASTHRTWRTCVVLTSALATFLLLTQVVTEWIAPLAESSAGKRTLLSLMLLVAFAMAFYSVHAERPPEFYDLRGDREGEGKPPKVERKESARAGL